MKTSIKPMAHPLIGKCFVVWGDERKVSRQGVVRAVMGDLCLVQFFEWVLGDPSTLMVVALSAMAAEPLSLREKGTWEFFEDDEHLRDWMSDYNRRQARSSEEDFLA